MTSVNPGSTEPGDYERPSRVAVVFNPSSGGDTAAERRDRLKKKLADAGVDVRWYETTPEDGGKGLARQAVADGADLVIASGGDGTVMACATALSGTDVPLAVLPFGTGNLVASNFDIPNDPDKALEIALECRRRRIDLGAHGDDRFVIAAGLGFDAAMLRDADRRLKARIGPLAYVISASRHIHRATVGFRLTFDGGDPVTRRGQGVMVCNLGRIQGGLPVLPDAVPDDGKFDVAVFRTRSLRDWLVVAFSVLTRRRRRPREMETFRASKVEVRCEVAEPLQFDGDSAEPVDRLEVEIVPKALTLAVPAHQVDQTPPVRRHPA
jgi:YegS/Rv2252/BmrU family lipid kinase